jgi:glycosyltransferase involved in cell wall biosynthesis
MGISDVRDRRGRSCVDSSTFRRDPAQIPSNSGSHRPWRATRRGGEGVQFHILSFEGPDGYSRAGGLATRVEGLATTLAALGFEAHLWFIGAPDLPGHEQLGSLHLHRWGQWISRYHPGGVYDGEQGKVADYTRSLPGFLLREVLGPYLESASGRSIVLAEEWQSAEALIALDEQLRAAGLRDRVSLFWNANNTFGFEGIRWSRLVRAAQITTVSRYMKHLMWAWGVDPLVVPNGLTADVFDGPDRGAYAALRRRFGDRTLLTKLARWDPDKRWLATIDTVSEMKRAGWRPLLIARGGSEPHGAEVLAAAEQRGLRRIDRVVPMPGIRGLVEALVGVDEFDVVNLLTPVDPESRRTLYRASDAVLANSGHEPFGLVGLETMAAGGIACTGCSGEDYAVAGRNALVLQTDDPREFLWLLARLRSQPAELQTLRREARRTARQFAWPSVIERLLFPRIEFQWSAGPPAPLVAS